MALERRECLWHQLTSLHTGMGRVALWTLESTEDLRSALREIPAGAPVMPFGHGTNCLGSDQDGWNLLRWKNPGELPEPEGTNKNILHVTAGTPLPRLAHYAASRGLGGLSPLSGIPGTLGGAVRMNAGANGRQLSDFLWEWRGVDLSDGTQLVWHKGEGGFGYRTSPLKDGQMVTEALLELTPSDSEAELRLIQEETARRREKNPQGPSAGSIFRNPPGDSAGRLLEAAGCKGLRRGPLVVSEQHANWILNPTATPASTQDALALMAEMQRRVPGLQPEVRALF